MEITLYNKTLLPDMPFVPIQRFTSDKKNCKLMIVEWVKWNLNHPARTMGIDGHIRIEAK